MAKPGSNSGLQALKSVSFKITKNSKISQVLIFSHSPRIASFSAGSSSSFMSLYCSGFQNTSIRLLPGQCISYLLVHNRFFQNLVSRNSNRLLLCHTVLVVQSSRRAQLAGMGLRSLLKLQSSCWSRLQSSEGLTRAGGAALSCPLTWTQFLPM